MLVYPARLIILLTLCAAAISVGGCSPIRSISGIGSEGVLDDPTIAGRWYGVNEDLTDSGARHAPTNTLDLIRSEDGTWSATLFRPGETFEQLTLDLNLVRVGEETVFDARLADGNVSHDWFNVSTAVLGGIERSSRSMVISVLLAMEEEELIPEATATGVEIITLDNRPRTPAATPHADAEHEERLAEEVFVVGDVAQTRSFLVAASRADKLEAILVFTRDPLGPIVADALRGVNSEQVAEERAIAAIRTYDPWLAALWQRQQLEDE